MKTSDKLDLLIKDHYLIDTKRSSFSNLIKKVKLEDELFLFIDNYLSFGTFKQKLYHYLNSLPNKKLICSVCNKAEINWSERNNFYRTTCSSICNGKLSGTKNRDKKDPHPILETKDEFISYFSKNKIKLVEQTLIKIYPDLVRTVLDNIHLSDVIFAEKVYLYLFDMLDKPICLNCRVDSRNFSSFTQGYHDYCSVKCSSNSIDKKNRIKDTVLEKYGVENIGSVTREKAMKTMIQRYGGHISTTKQFKDKYEATSLERYGVCHIFKTESFKNNCVNYFTEKYGVDRAMRVKSIVNKGLIKKIANGTIYKWKESELKDIKSYRRSVCYYTEIIYEKYRDVINPLNLERGIYSNHIDHIFPVIEGWKNGISPKDICHVNNLRLISSYDNLSKGDRTNISVEEFFKLIT